MLEIITAVNTVLCNNWTPTGKRKMKQSDYVDFALSVVAIHNEGGGLEQIAKYLCAKSKQRKGTDIEYAALDVARKIIEAINATNTAALNDKEPPI